jgi:hypothetical protein
MAGGGTDRAGGARRDPHPILLPAPVPDADCHSSRRSSPRHSGGGHRHHCLVKVPREDPWDGRRRRGRREPVVRVGEGEGAGTGGSAQEGRGDRRSWAATAGGGAGTGVGGRHGMRRGTGGGDGRARRDTPPPPATGGRRGLWDGGGDGARGREGAGRRSSCAAGWG